MKVQEVVDRVVKDPKFAAELTKKVSRLSSTGNLRGPHNDEVWREILAEFADGPEELARLASVNGRSPARLVDDVGDYRHRIGSHACWRPGARDHHDHDDDGHDVAVTRGMALRVRARSGARRGACDGRRCPQPRRRVVAASNRRR